MHHIKQVKKGIFEIAFEQPQSFRTVFLDFFSSIQLVQRHSKQASRLVKDLILIAPGAVFFHTIASLWPGVSSALYLWSFALLLETGTQFSIVDQVSDARLDSLQALAVLLVCCSSMNAFFEQLSYRSSRRIKYGIKHHFYPKLAQKSLSLDLNIKAPDVQTVFPHPWAFEIDNSLGWEFLSGLTAILQNFVTIAVHITMVFAILAIQTMFLPNVIVVCCIVLPTLMVCIPTNGLGGVGYSFWTSSPSYHRLAALHQIIFDIEYKKTLLKDGSVNFVLHEYERCMKELGFLSFDAEMLCYGIPIAWYWQLLQILVDVPPVGLLFMYPSIKEVSSMSWLITGLFVQYTATQLKNSINKVKTTQKPLHEVLGMAENFYKALNAEGSLRQGFRSYPDRTHSLPSGMRLTFRNVSLIHQTSLSTHPAIINVSFDIAPGQLVLLVGKNGSGKTSLLHLISRLFEPSAGTILIDGVPIQEFDLQSLRESMVVLLQTEAIYPLSIRDNLSMSLSELDRARCHAKPECFDRAAKLGGSYGFIDNLVEKYETVLNPVGHFNTSSDIFGNGPVSPAVLEEMRRNAPKMSSIPLSSGEKQRLIASRAFMKLNSHSDVRLLVVDEATSALDAPAERDLLERLMSHSGGKTTIFVTHQFRYLAQKADLILCMHEGKLVQQGTHEQLMLDREGEYATLYKAQL